MKKNKLFAQILAGVMAVLMLLGMVATIFMF